MNTKNPYDYSHRYCSPMVVTGLTQAANRRIKQAWIRTASQSKDAEKKMDGPG